MATKQNRILVSFLIIAAIFILVQTGNFPLFSVVNPPSDGIISFWDFNGGTAQDKILSNNGQIQGTIKVGGVLGDALLFDGVSDKLIIPHSSSLDIQGDMTLSLWVKIDELPFREPMIIFDKSKPGSGGFSLKLDKEGHLNFCTIKGIESCVVFPRYSSMLGDWAHIAAVNKNNLNMIYVNGFLLNELRGALGPSDSDISIGVLKGRIDEVSIFNRALEGSEIASYFNSVLTTTTVQVAPTVVITVEEKVCFSIQEGDCVRRDISSEESCRAGEFSEGEDCILLLASKLSIEEGVGISNIFQDTRLAFLFIIIIASAVFFTTRKK